MHCTAERRQAPGKGRHAGAEGRGRSGENQRKGEGEGEAEEEIRAARKAATGEGDEGKAPDAGEVPSLLPRPMGHPHHHRPTQRGTYCQISLSSGSSLQFLLPLQGSSSMHVDFRCPSIVELDRFFIPSILAYLPHPLNKFKRSSPADPVHARLHQATPWEKGKSRTNQLAPAPKTSIKPPVLTSELFSCD